MDKIFEKCKSCLFVTKPSILACDRCSNNILYQPAFKVIKIKVLINSTNPFEVAVVNLTENTVEELDGLIFKCDGGTESLKIDGFFTGLRYVGYDYHRCKDQVITPDNSLFELCGFVDYSSSFKVKE